MLKKLAILLSPDLAGGGAGGAAVVEPPAAAPAHTVPPTASDDPFAELDAMAVPPKKPAKVEPKPAADTRPADTKIDPKPDPAKAVDKPVDKEDKTFQTPKALRDHAKRLETDLKVSSEKMKTLEAKIADFERKGQDTTKLTERLGALEKERDEFKAQVWEVKFERSDEFQGKYERPFKTAADSAKKLIEGLEVTETTESGEVKRPATWQDFSALYAMPLSKSMPLITKLFGDTATIVSHEMLALQKMDRARSEALQEGISQREKREQEAETKRIKEREDAETRTKQIADLWTKTNQEVAEKHPEYFQPDPKDKEAAAILTKSFATLDARYGDKDMPVEKQVAMDAQIRNRAAAHPLMVYRLNKANERIAELESALAEKDESPPGETHRPGGATAPAKEQSFDEALAELKA